MAAEQVTTAANEIICDAFGNFGLICRLEFVFCEIV